MAEKHICALFGLAFALAVGCVVAISMTAAELCSRHIVAFC